MKAAAAVFLVLLIFIDFSLSWTYHDEKSWPGQCTSGTQQSPTNIRTKNVIVDKKGEIIKAPLKYKGYENVSLTPMNDGHTLRWDVVQGRLSPTLSGGPLKGKYWLAQLHLHWLSEHAIDGKKFALEVHMVHFKSGLTQEEAVTLSDGITVIAILYEVHTDSLYSNFALAELFPVVPDLIHSTEDDTNSTRVDLTRVLGKNLQSYYTYEGSLTTPNCDESVVWIIFDHYQIMSDTQYKILSTVDVGGMNNFRRLQPNQPKVFRTAASGASLHSIPGNMALHNLDSY